MNYTVSRESHKIVLNEDQSDYVIYQYFTKNRSLNSIAKDFSCSPQVIARTIRDKGLEPREVGESNRVYMVNHSYFSTIDTERKAYWLGFLYADGTINEKRKTVTLGLKSEDINHIKKFISDLDSNNPIYEVKKVVDDKEYFTSAVNIYSKQMVKDLVSLGCVQNKSLVIEFPTDSQLPSELVIHFIRGYFDGDGSISYTTPYSERRQYRFSVIGTKNFIDALKDKMDVTHLKTQKTKNHYYLGTTGGKQTKLFLEKLYNGSEVYLDRKYIKYQELLNYSTDNPVVAWNKKLTK